MGVNVGSVDLDLVLQSQSFERQLKRAVDSAGRTVKSNINSLNSSIQNCAKLAIGAFSVKGIKDFTESCLELGSSLTEVQNVVDVTFGDLNKEINTFSKNAIKAYGLSETIAKQYSGSFGAMANAVGYNKDQMVEMAETLTGLTGDVASFYNLTQKEAYTKLKSVFTGETESLKDLGVVMTQANLDNYALANGFGKTTSQMTELEKTTLRYQFVLDKLSNASGDFARTSTSWANQTRILKLQFDGLKASIGQGLINAFTPAIIFANELLSKLNDIISKLGWFQGNDISSSVGDINSTISQTSSYMDNITESTKKATKQLMGFDEINKLSKNGLTSNSLNIGAILETGTSSEPDPQPSKTDEMKERIQNFLKKLKESWDKADFFDIGAEIVKKIKDKLKEIKWDDIKKEAIKLAKRLGSFINGLLSDEETYKEIGKAFANALNTALIFALKLGLEIDWKQAGIDISALINGFFDEYDFATLGESINVWVQGIWTLVKTTLDNIEWKDVWSGIKETLSSLDLETVEIVVGAVVLKSAIEGASGLLTGGLLKAIIVKKLGLGAGVSVGTELAGAGTAAGAGATAGAGASLAGLAGTIGTIGVVVAGVASVVYSISQLPQDLQDLKEDTTYVINGIKETFHNDMTDLKEDSTYVINGIKETFHNDMTDLKEDSSYVINGIKETFHNDMTDLKEDTSYIIGGIKTTLESDLEDLKEDGSYVINALSEKLQGVKSTLQNVKESASEKISNAKESASSFLSNLKIPHLANGGYVGANTPRLAMIGDNQTHGEIVAPEDKMYEVFTSAMGDFFSRMQGTTQQSGGGDITIPIYLGSQKLDEMIITAQQRQAMRNGGR